MVFLRVCPNKAPIVRLGVSLVHGVGLVAVADLPTGFELDIGVQFEEDFSTCLCNRKAPQRAKRIKIQKAASIIRLHY